MTYYKTIARDINVNGKKRKDLLLNAEIFSYDEQVSKFVLTLQNDIDDINLNGAKVLAVMEYLVNGEKGSVEALSGVESTSDRSIYFIVPSKLRGFEGSVTAGVYINLTSGEKIDIQNLKFKMSKSLIDSTSGPAAEIYFESFDEVLIKVKNAGDIAINAVNTEAKKVSDHADQKIKEYDAKFTQSDQKMTELQQSQTELSNQLTETNKKIDEADVYRKSETMSSEEISANVIYQVIGKDKVRLTYIFDLNGKVVNSINENPNVVRHWQGTSLANISNGAEFSQVGYNNIFKLDGVVSTFANSTNGNMKQIISNWKILELLKRELNEQFFIDRGANSLEEQTKELKKIISEVETSAWARGSNQNGNKITLASWHTPTQSWQYKSSSTSSDITRVSNIPLQASLPAYIDDNGEYSSLLYAEASDASVPSVIDIDYMRLKVSIDISANEHIKSMMAAYHRPFEAQLNDLAGRILALENK